MKLNLFQTYSKDEESMLRFYKILLIFLILSSICIGSISAKESAKIYWAWDQDPMEEGKLYHINIRYVGESNLNDVPTGKKDNMDIPYSYLDKPVIVKLSSKAFVINGPAEYTLDRLSRSRQSFDIKPVEPGKKQKVILIFIFQGENKILEYKFKVDVLKDEFKRDI